MACHEQPSIFMRHGGLCHDRWRTVWHFYAPQRFRARLMAWHEQHGFLTSPRICFMAKPCACHEQRIDDPGITPDLAAEQPRAGVLKDTH